MVTATGRSGGGAVDAHSVSGGIGGPFAAAVAVAVVGVGVVVVRLVRPDGDALPGGEPLVEGEPGGGAPAVVVHQPEGSGRQGEVRRVEPEPGHEQAIGGEAAGESAQDRGLRPRGEQRDDVAGGDDEVERPVGGG